MQWTPIEHLLCSRHCAGDIKLMWLWSLPSGAREVNRSLWSVQHARRDVSTGCCALVPWDCLAQTRRIWEGSPPDKFWKTRESLLMKKRQQRVWGPEVQLPQFPSLWPGAPWSLGAPSSFSVNGDDPGSCSQGVERLLLDSGCRVFSKVPGI